MMPRGCLKSAIRDDNAVIFFEHKLLYKERGEVPEGDYTVPIGKADIKKRGEDVTIVSYSLMVHKALHAARELEKQGISAEVIDLRTLLPLDEATIVESVKKTSRLVIVHEASKNGGIGGEIAGRVAESDAFYYLDAPIKRVCGKDMPIPYTPVLEKQVVPEVADIIQAVKEIVR
jgi:acetoin:2,6-dichlorophenolindophenol oxidoreductase subunit beta